jgi:hypothetical protein
MRNYHLTARLLLCVIGMSFFGCEKALIKTDQDYTPTKLFEYLWEDLHQRYSYFSVKQIDWFGVKSKYEPLIHNQLNEYELFEILGDVLAELQDGHVNLLSTFNRSRNWEWFQNYPVNYNEQFVFDHYLGTSYRIIGPLLAQSIDGILYVHYRSFERTIAQSHMDEVIRLMQAHKGLIIDIRNNGGGSLQNAITLVSRFTDSTFTYGEQRFKTGPEEDAFTPWTKMQVTSQSGEKYLGKIAVLTNRRSYSAASFFAQMMKVLPHAALFGDQTGGGGGIPAYAELPNGWTYRFSASQAVDLDAYHIEFGVLPDYKIDLNTVSESTGKDDIIEAAIEWLKS